MSAAPTAPTYADREREALRAFALTVFQDATSTADDRAGARDRLTRAEQDASCLSDAELEVARAILAKTKGQPVSEDAHGLALAACEVAGQFVGQWERAKGETWTACPCCSGPLPAP